MLHASFVPGYTLGWLLPAKLCPWCMPSVQCPCVQSHTTVCHNVYQGCKFSWNVHLGRQHKLFMVQIFVIGLQWTFEGTWMCVPTVEHVSGWPALEEDHFYASVLRKAWPQPAVHTCKFNCARTLLSKTLVGGKFRDQYRLATKITNISTPWKFLVIQY